MWNAISVPADHLGTGSAPAPFSNFPPRENTEFGMTFQNKYLMNNYWRDQTNPTACQAPNWSGIMSTTDTVTLNEHQKPDLDFADITSTIQVDESDFMQYTIEDMKLEWPPELKPSSHTGRVSPVPEILRAESPLPVLSNFAVSGILGNLAPVSPPPQQRPSILPENGSVGHFPNLIVPDVRSPVYLNHRPSTQNSLYHLPPTSKNSLKTSKNVTVHDGQKVLPAVVISIGNCDQQEHRQVSDDEETKSASDISWRESSDDDFAKKFEREDQMEEILQCYYKGGINADDNFIYCDVCNRRWCRNCPQHGRLKHMRDRRVPMGKEGRARETAPRSLSILPSKIKGANKGVWTKKPISNRTCFGPYEGCEVPLHHTDGEYCWKVMKDGKPLFLVDGSDPNRSNWMRYINCARTAAEQNLEAFQFKGSIYYRTTKNIDANQELLVWYGYKFAQKLGIKWKDFVESELPNKKGTDVVFSCDSCFHAYTNPIVLELHQKLCRCRRSLTLSKECTEERKTLPVSSEDSSICMEVTLGDMPITCGVCGARFRRRGKALQDHMKSHSDRKHTCCLKCGQWFPSLFALDEHNVAASRRSKELPDPNLKPTGVICQIKYDKNVRSKLVKKELKLPECTIKLRGRRKAAENGINENQPIAHTDGQEEARPISHTELKEERPISHTDGQEETRPISHTQVNEERPISHTDGQIKSRPISNTATNEVSQAERRDQPVPVPTRRHTYDQLLCDRCGAMFPRISLLSKHLEFYHGFQSKEKELFAKTCQPRRFQCKECGIMYRKKATLERHLKLHEETSEHEDSEDGEDEMKFSCNKCDIKFRAEVTLKYHMEVHNEKPQTSSAPFNSTSAKKYKCKVCQVRFKARSTLTLHKKMHVEKMSTDKRSPTLLPKSKMSFFSGNIFRNPSRTNLVRRQKDVLPGGVPVQSKVGILQDGKNSTPHCKDEKCLKISKRGNDDTSGVTISKKPRRVACLECLACGFIFKDRVGLDAHVQKHIEEKMLVCDLSRARVPVALQELVHSK